MSFEDIRISVFGLGYVGSVNLACFGRSHDIIGVDIKAEKIAKITAGKSPVDEPHVGNMIEDNLKNGRVTTTTNTRKAVIQSDVALLCVGTPYKDNLSGLDMSILNRVIKGIGNVLSENVNRKNDKPFHIVIRSTVMPGTMVNIRNLLQMKNLEEGDDYGLALNPEFLREGSAVDDFFNPPQIVVGTECYKTREILWSMYSNTLGYTEAKNKFVSEESRVVEMIKLVNNSWHAVKVAFGNEVGRVCKYHYVSGDKVMNLMMGDRVLNISDKYLTPGFAYGGSCLPKDTEAMDSLRGVTPLIRGAIDSNEAHIRHALGLIKHHSPDSIGFIGFAFKEGTDDIRNSPFKVLKNMVIEDKVCKPGNINIYEPKLENWECDISDIDNSELIVVGNKNYLEKILNEDHHIFDDKIVLDLVNSWKLENHPGIFAYEGICW